jgi:hypothetical protein
LKTKLLYIGIDFDGTIVKHNYPLIGEDVPWAFAVIGELMMKGHKLILHTMRGGKELDAAVKHIKAHGIKLFGINENKHQSDWTDSKKVWAEIYIDDAALGCPLTSDLDGNVFVDWIKVELELKKLGVL